MKKILFITLIIMVCHIGNSQIDTTNQRMIPMKETIEKPYKVGSKYYKKGESKPFTGVLYGKYKNGKYLTLQEYKDGVGNGLWINYYENGNVKEIGTYRDNKVEGPVTKYYSNGNIKAKGTYKHWKKKIGTWDFYSKDGKLIKTETYQR